MKTFVDARTRLVFATGFARGVPNHVGQKAHRVLHLLLAVTGWKDIGVIGQVGCLRGIPNRYGVCVDGKWYVTFEFSEDVGVREMLLERR
jgi:hypothetical protein